MAANSKQSKLSEKGDECTFTWKVFASWDYGIANVETAHNKVASIVMGFREALVEEMEREKMAEKNWKTIAKRVLANVLVIALLVGSAYAVVVVVDRSNTVTADDENSWIRQNEITIVMNVISVGVPYFFDLVGLIEGYHPRKAMRWMLARIMVLNLLSLLTLIMALFAKTNGIISVLERLHQQKQNGTNFGLEQVTTPAPAPRDCYNIPVPCWLLESDDPRLPAPLSLYYELPPEDKEADPAPVTAPAVIQDLFEDLSTNITLEGFFANVSSSNHSSDGADDLVLGDDRGMVDTWLHNLTRSSKEKCPSCLERCGHGCFDLCHLITDCSGEENPGYRSCE